nr:RNA-directed DNA polymerase, eukaryota [Tanacetum cinerariifolium]
MWDYISSLIARWNGETIVMGDFNEVRSIDERFGSMFNQSSSRLFNHFITSSGLVDVKLEGYSFMWAHPSATKMSKLDRFLVSEDNNGLIRFKKKLQDLKKIIFSWIKDKKLQQSCAINSIKEDLVDIDKNLDSENVSDEILLKRMELTRKLHDINQMEAMDYVQKSKIKWAIEGDENSKFFHEVVKDVFKDYFATRFKQPAHGRLKLNIAFSNRLSTDQVADMDRCVSRDEIRVAVWNCGENKSPGPDGPISLIGCVYKVVTKILANRLATVISDLVSDIQSAFVANRQIFDGPFILNELLAWCKRKKNQAMIFTVNFAKAYDSVRWDYLLDVLQAFGFGPNWCKATSDGLFKGIQIQRSMAISHLFYADGAIFIGEWSDFNLDNIVKILKCFFLASGLKINIQKSQVLGVGVPRNIVNQTASLIGCDVMQNPFRLTLLKSVLGASPLYNMSIYKVPKGILKEMEAIRCDFFNGADPAKRKITWVSWDKVLTSKKNGGLGVLSFHTLNRALLLKWVWRFLSQDGSLWYRVIQALYGASFELHPVNQSSIWCSILREMQVLISKSFDFVSHCKKRVGDGHNTRFWYDSWIFDQPLRVRFSRLFALETDKESTVASKLGSSSVDASFRRSVRDGVERQ